MNSKTYHDIRKAIEAGTYKLVRLVEVTEKGNSIVIPYNGVGRSETGGQQQAALDRLEFIRMKCTKALKPGNYIVECRISNQNKNIVEHYEVLIEGVTVINNTIDKTNEQVTDMNIDYYEHIKLIQENAELKAQITQLQFENSWIKEHGVKVATLSDGSPVPAVKDGNQMLADVFSETLPALVNMGDRMFGIKERQLDIEEKKLSSGMIKKTSNKNGMQKITRKKEPTFEEIAQEEASYMEQLNPEEFDKEMDILQEEDPELYDRVCEILEIDFEEEEDQEEQLQ